LPDILEFLNIRRVLLELPPELQILIGSFFNICGERDKLVLELNDGVDIQLSELLVIVLVAQLRLNMLLKNEDGHFLPELRLIVFCKHEFI
jgi:hypothetical protein